MATKKTAKSAAKKKTTDKVKRVKVAGKWITSDMSDEQIRKLLSDVPIVDGKKKK